MIYYENRLKTRGKMELELEAISVEEYLKSVVKSTNDLVCDLVDRKKLPYTENDWKPSPKNVSTSIELTDLNKQITELNKADLGLEKSLIISAENAQIIGLRFCNKDVKEIPYFEVVKNGESKMTEVQYMYFLDQFTKESVEKVFNLVNTTKEDPILQAKVRATAKSLVDNFISFDVGHREKKKESKARSEIRKNLKSDSENSKKMKMFYSKKNLTKEQKIVYKVLHSYYVGQLAGKHFLSSSISNEIFNSAAKRLAGNGMFLKTAFDAQMGALRLADSNFQLPKEKSFSYPKASFVKEFDEKVVSKSKSENLEIKERFN